MKEPKIKHIVNLRSVQKESAKRNDNEQRARQ